MEKLLTAREAAALLGVRLSTLYTWAQRHRVPTQYVGRCLRFSPAELEAWLTAQRRPASSPFEPTEAA
ncbi:MAG: helix-turn-helix domain-containing protein [Deltaproteobacteria bacterium]|nr:MAG: helix-turn-helix domain-containing protein [Deltaproteobacteria bacterium]